MIYAIQRGLDGPIKIGLAKDPSKRLGDLQVGCPDQLVLLAVGDLPNAAEKAFHRRLDAHHVRGEWFMPTDEVMAVVREIGRLPEFVGPERPNAAPSPRQSAADLLAEFMAPIAVNKSPLRVTLEQAVLHARAWKESGDVGSGRRFVEFYNASARLSGSGEEVEWAG